MKNKKIEVELRSALKALVTWVCLLLLCFVGMSGILGHTASLTQSAGALALVFAVYLLMPTKPEDA